MAELNPVSLHPTEDAQVDISPTNDAGRAAPVTGFAVSSSDTTIIANGVVDATTATRARCVTTGTEGSAVLTITGTNSKGDVLVDHVTVTVSAESVATVLNSAVTAVAK